MTALASSLEVTAASASTRSTFARSKTSYQSDAFNCLPAKGRAQFFKGLRIGIDDGNDMSVPVQLLRQPRTNSPQPTIIIFI